MSGDYFELGYPPAAFYFSVTFDPGGSIFDGSFSEVSGIGTEFEMEPVAEGGENRYVHQLPTRVKHGNLELKRGITKKMSPLVRWCKQTLEGELAERIELRTVTVSLLNASGAVLRSWQFNDAYPVKWTVDGFSSTKNEVAIEHIALSYTYSQRTA
jgi:phage tail-like protein